MGRKSTCPGCKSKFTNGRPFSVHIGLCKNIDSAADTAISKHKIITAKKKDEKKARIEASQNQNALMILDVDIQEVSSLTMFYSRSSHILFQK